jgi:hypothetical protein
VLKYLIFKKIGIMAERYNFFYFIEGRIMKHHNILKLFLQQGVMILLTVFAASAAVRAVTVSGTVLDSASMQPVPQAMVVFHDMATLSIDTSNLANFLSTLKLDTAYTGTDGKFSYSLKINPSSLIILCGALKQGYALGYSITFLLSSATSANFGTIKLQKASDVAKDTLLVSGTIVDSATNGPLENCHIIMTGAGVMDTIGNTAISGANGSFSRTVIIGSSGQALAFVVNKEGYQPFIGHQQYSSKQVDLGTIKMKKTTGIRTGSRLITVPRGFFAATYSLNGRFLYAGTLQSLKTRKEQSPGMTVVRLTTNGKWAVTDRKVNFLK